MDAELLSDRARERARKLDTVRTLRAATVRTDAAAIGDPVYVTFDQVSRTARRGPCFGWAPMGARLPQVGDPAWVEEADDGTLVVSAWRPKP